jgi:hypothetical protein
MVYVDSRNYEEGSSVIDLTFAISIILAENSYFQTQTAYRFVLILIAILVTGIALATNYILIWIFCLLVIIGFIVFGIYDYTRASTKLKEMSTFREASKRAAAERVGRLSSGEKRLMTEPASGGATALEVAEAVRMLLRMAEASRFSQLR